MNESPKPNNLKISRVYVHMNKELSSYVYEKDISKWKSENTVFSFHHSQ